MKFDPPERSWHPLSEAVLLYHFSPSWEDATPAQLLNSILRFLSSQQPLVKAEFEDDAVQISWKRSTGDSEWLEPVGQFAFGKEFRLDEGLDEEPPPEFRAQAETLLQQFIQRVDRLFRKHHAAGRLRVFARVGRPTEPSFSEMPPDVFAHFNVIDWGPGVARSSDGTMLYSIHAGGPEGGETRAETAAKVAEEAKSGPQYKWMQFASWAQSNDIVRGGERTLDQIKAKYLRDTKRSIDIKTMNKAFDVIEEEQGK